MVKVCVCTHFGHRVSRPRGTGSVGDSVGEGTHTHLHTHTHTHTYTHRKEFVALHAALLIFFFFFDTHRKEFVALHAALVKATEQESAERKEEGAGRTNVILPRLPQERSVGTALSLVARYVCMCVCICVCVCV